MDHSENPYIPFEMCKIRSAFQRIKSQASSWEECRKQLSQWEQKERERQNRLASEAEERRQFAQNEKAAVLKAVRDRCNAEKRQVQIAKSSARKQLLDELAKLSPKERLEHVAWDDSHPLDYFPSEMVKSAISSLEVLSLPTRERLKIKLAARRGGVWKKLCTEIDKMR